MPLPPPFQSKISPRKPSPAAPVAAVDGRTTTTIKKPTVRKSCDGESSARGNRTTTMETNSMKAKKKVESSSKVKKKPQEVNPTEVAKPEPKRSILLAATLRQKRSSEAVSKSSACTTAETKTKNTEVTKKAESLDKKPPTRRSLRMKNQDKQQQASRAIRSMKNKKKSARPKNVEKPPASSALPGKNIEEQSKEPAKTELKMPSRRLPTNNQLATGSAQPTTTPPASQSTAPTTKTLQASQMTATAPTWDMTRPFEQLTATSQQLTAVPPGKSQEPSQAHAVSVEHSLIAFPDINSSVYTRGSVELIVQKQLNQKTMGAGGHRAMEEFRQYILSQTWKKVTSEFEQIQKIQPIGVVPRDKLKTAFHPAIPCLDYNKVITMDVDRREHLYHASRFIMAAKPGISDFRFVLAQAPPTGHTPSADRSVEDFWQTVYHEEPSLMILLSPVYEDGKGSNCFPPAVGDYVTYGGMMVTTKKVDILKYGTCYVFEILPEGCSNATFVKMIHCEHWAARTTPTLRGILPLIQQCRDADLGPNTTTTIMLVSRKGIGRPAVLVTACIVYNRLLQGHFTPIFNAAINLRNQRAMAFENLAQYGFIYMTVAGYIRSCCTGDSSQWAEVMKHIGQWLPSLAKSWDTNSSYM